MDEKKIRNKWDELKKFIPFLKYIRKMKLSKQSYNTALYFIENPEDRPEEIAEICERKIIKLYKKFEKNKECPPLVDVFNLKEDIVNEEDDSDTSSCYTNSRNNSENKCTNSKNVENNKSKITPNPDAPEEGSTTLGNDIVKQDLVSISDKEKVDKSVINGTATSVTQEMLTAAPIRCRRNAAIPTFWIKDNQPLKEEETSFDFGTNSHVDVYVLISDDENEPNNLNQSSNVVKNKESTTSKHHKCVAPQEDGGTNAKTTASALKDDIFNRDPFGNSEKRKPIEKAQLDEDNQHLKLTTVTSVTHKTDESVSGLVVSIAKELHNTHVVDVDNSNPSPNFVKVSYKKSSSSKHVERAATEKDGVTKWTTSATAVEKDILNQDLFSKKNGNSEKQKLIEKEQIGNDNHPVKLTTGTSATQQIHETMPSVVSMGIEPHDVVSPAAASIRRRRPTYGGLKRPLSTPPSTTQPKKSCSDLSNTHLVDVYTFVSEEEDELNNLSPSLNLVETSLKKSTSSKFVKRVVLEDVSITNSSTTASALEEEIINRDLFSCEKQKAVEKDQPVKFKTVTSLTQHIEEPELPIISMTEEPHDVVIPTAASIRKRRQTYGGFQRTSSPPQTSAQITKVNRELKNLFCSLRLYTTDGHMVENNAQSTVKRRRGCAPPVGSMAEGPDDMFWPAAAPIRRRRKTVMPSSQERNTQCQIENNSSIQPKKGYHENMFKNNFKSTIGEERSCVPSEGSTEEKQDINISPALEMQSSTVKDTPPVKQYGINQLSSTICEPDKSDIEQHQTANENSLNKYPQVTLEKLNKIDQSSLSTKCINSEAKTVKNLSQDTSPTRNNDINMTVESTNFCIICKKCPLELTDHFVNAHKTESYTSRLILKQITYLKSNIPNATVHRKKYKIICIICNDYIEETLTGLYEHYSVHTGEFAYQCSVCKLIKPFRVDIRSHQLHSIKCRNSKILQKYSFKTYNSKMIVLYTCELCNFCQLTEENIHKHQRDHHTYPNNNPDAIKKYTIAVLDTKEASEVSLAECDAEITKPEENVTTDHEQQTAIEYTLDINNPYTECKSYPDSTPFDSNNRIPSPNLPVEAPLSGASDAIALRTNHQQSTTVADKPNIEMIRMNTSKESMAKPKQVNQRIVYRKTKPNSKYWGMYKCMIDDCWFSSNLADSFLKHATYHDDKTSFICSYCNGSMTSAKNLVCHVVTQHSASRYQCSECTYRSYIPGNVNIHRSLEHKGSTADKCIYECTEELTNAENQREANINMLKCSECGVEYNALSLFEFHMSQSHPFSENMCDMSHEYVCIFCKGESNSLGNMQIHMATEHPDIPSIVRMRELSTDDCIDACENLKMVDISPDVLPTDIHKTKLEEFMQLNEPSNPEHIVNDVGSLTSSARLLIESKEDNQTLPVKKFESMYRTAADNATKEKHILMKRIKDYLDLFTENTGIANLDLYSCNHCKISFIHYDLLLKHVLKNHNNTEDMTCPYCNENISIEKIASHISSHGRHSYICIECMSSFCSRENIKNHINIEHKGSDSYNRIIIKHSLESYYIFQKQSMAIDQNLCNKIRNKLIERMQTNMYSEWLKRLTPSCIDELSIPEFKNTISLFKCSVRSCSFTASNENGLDVHLNTHASPANHTCNYCLVIMRNPSWDEIKNHEMLHSGELIICSVCKFVHHHRLGMSSHIKSLHNLRNVPVISLSRNANELKISLSIVLPAGKSTLKTECFCCLQKMQSSVALLRHLKIQHNITLCLKCVKCDKILLTQDEISEHAKEHEHQNMKLKYNILAPYMYTLDVRSMCPFLVEVNPIRERRTNFDDDFSKKSIRMNEQPVIDIKDEVVIKNENDYTEAAEIGYDSYIPLQCVKIHNLVSSDTSTQEHTTNSSHK